MEAWREELYHHGILGMHWGIRRYQNKDGSLTPAGQKRLAKLNKKMNKLRGTQVSKENEIHSEKFRLSDFETARERKKYKDTKYMSKLTDEELVDRINRANLEKEYQKAIGIEDKKKEPSVVKNAIKAFVPTAITLIGTNYINNKFKESSLKKTNEIQKVFDDLKAKENAAREMNTYMKKLAADLDKYKSQADIDVSKTRRNANADALKTMMISNNVTRNNMDLEKYKLDVKYLDDLRRKLNL